MYTWGTIPKFESREVASEDYVFQKGQWGQIENHVFTVTIPPFPSEIDFASAYKKELENKGAVVTYIKVSSKWVYEPFMYAEYTVVQCFFYGDAIPVAVILGIILLVGIFMLLYKPVIFKLAGVSPTEAIGYDIGTILIIGLLVLLVFIIMMGRK